MKVGINLPNYTDGATPESILARARMAEDLGYHSVLISDHVAITPDVAPRYPEPFYDPFATLAWLAGQTTRVMLGTTVCVVPYRHPVLTARLVANIDRFSGGRFIFGVGVGGNAAEFAVLGQSTRHRGAVTDEYIDVMRALWDTEGTLTRPGRFVDIQDVQGLAWARRPDGGHVPVWVGGRSDAALARTVRIGDGWHPIGGSIDWLRNEALPALAKRAADAGKQPPAFCPRIRIELTAAPVDGPERPPGTGSIEQVHRDLASLEELGATHLTVDWYKPGIFETARDDDAAFAMLETLAEQVIDLSGERVR